VRADTYTFRDVNLADLMQDFLGHPSPSQDIPFDRISRLKTFLRHVRVETKYLKNDKGAIKAQRKTISGVNPRPPRGVEFELSDVVKGSTTKTNVAQFFSTSK
jgi:hypothetical protein